MTTTVNACACHGNLGIEPTTGPESVLEKLSRSRPRG